MYHNDPPLLPPPFDPARLDWLGQQPGRIWREPARPTVEQQAPLLPTPPAADAPQSR